MSFGWKVLLPLATLNLVVTAVVVGARVRELRSGRWTLDDSLKGFAVTFRQMLRKPETIGYPEQQDPGLPALPRPPPPVALRERAGEVRRLLAVRGGLPGRLHPGGGRGEHAREPRLAGRALRAHLRDQHGPLHLLRLLRGGVPLRRHHARGRVRDERAHAAGDLLYDKEMLLAPHPKPVPLPQPRSRAWASRSSSGSRRPRRSCCGTLVITLKGPFRATVALIGTLLSVAVLFLLMAAPFVAAIQVIVYAGAIVVLFLFVIAYLGERPLTEVGRPAGALPVAAWLAVIGLAIQGVVVLATIELPGRARRAEAGGRHRQPPGHRPCVPRPLHRALRGHLAGAAGGGRGRGAAGQARRSGRRAGDERRRVPLVLYLALSGALFLLGLLGVMTRRNPLLLLLAVELMLNSSNVALVGFSRYWNVTDGQIFALVVMVVAAAEVVIGLGLVVAVFRQRLALDVDQMTSLKG